MPKNYRNVIITYILMLLSTVIIPLGIFFIFETDQFTSIIYTNIVAFIIGTIIMYFLLKEDLQLEKETNPLPVSSIIRWTVLGFLLAWVGQMVVVMIEMNILGITTTSENTEIIVRLAQTNTLFFFIPAIFGPIAEEFVFRKVIFGTMQKKYNVHVAAIVSSLIFAVAHLELDHLLVYFTMGLIFSFLYVKTKRIIVPIFAHMSLNMFAVLTQMFVDPEKIEQMQQQVSFIFF